MAAIYETAYPRIKPNLSYKELKEVFTPTAKELALLNERTKPTLDVSRLGFMILLKCYQYLGYPIKIQKLDVPIKKYIAEAISIDPSIDLSSYNKLTRMRHIKIIREYLELNSDKRERNEIMKKAALNAAETKENLADIINHVLEELVKSKYELPAFKRLVRLARAARTVVNYNNYQQIYLALSDVQKQLINVILNIEDADNQDKILFWNELKQEAKSPKNKNIMLFVDVANKLKFLRQQLDINLEFIAPARLEQLRDEAMAADVYHMREMRPIKRYALVTILIYMKATAAIDDLVQIFIIWIRRIHAQANKKLEDYRLQQADQTDDFILLLYNVLLALKNNKSERDKIKRIEENLNGETDTIIEKCEKHLGLTGENHISWVLKPYKNKRYIIYKILENLTIHSSSNDLSIEIALKYIMHHRHSHKEWLNLRNDDESIKPDLSLLSDEWFKSVTGVKKGTLVEKINRNYYEIAIFTILMDELNCGDVYVEGAFIYDNPNKQFITWEQFAQEVDSYCSLVKLSRDPGNYIGTLQKTLSQTASQVDKNYHDNPYLTIENGTPTLKKMPAKVEHPELDNIKKMIMSEMPLTNIVDVIIDVEKWLNLSAYFKPLSGEETKIQDYPPRFVATTLSYGCNLGPTQTERSLLSFNRKQIAWLFNHHVTEQKLIKALRVLINSYNLFELPRYWGNGNSVSVDGTFWDMYKQNLLAAHHLRYGEYGGIGYYHVSDMYIALVSNFISCGAHESIYLLDGIIENDSDIQPKKVHGDSWAQSEVLFGLASLLAVIIMPRIKNFKHLLYYKVSKDHHYENIDDIFTEKTIDWDLIKVHYHDMLRIAISIYKGKVKSSTILRKFCSKSRKNKLYFALRELGRVERTIFLLNYINDSELRRMIQAATCKSEEFNQFISWIRFGGGGVIGDNMRSNQRKIIKFNHLLANTLIFHTVVNQTKAINKLRSEGTNIPEEVLTGFAPYWTEHINRFGTFQVDMDKNMSDIEYNLENSTINS